MDAEDLGCLWHTDETVEIRWKVGDIRCHSAKVATAEHIWQVPLSATRRRPQAPNYIAEVR